MTLTIIIGILIGVLIYCSANLLIQIVNTYMSKGKKTFTLDLLVVCVLSSLIYILSNL